MAIQTGLAANSSNHGARTTFRMVSCRPGKVSPVPQNVPFCPRDGGDRRRVHDEFGFDD